MNTTHHEVVSTKPPNLVHTQSSRSQIQWWATLKPWNRDPWFNKMCRANELPNVNMNEKNEKHQWMILINYSLNKCRWHVFLTHFLFVHLPPLHLFWISFPWIRIIISPRAARKHFANNEQSPSGRNDIEWQFSFEWWMIWFSCLRMSEWRMNDVSQFFLIDQWRSF